ncbi:MAG TPA: hypothetical protein VHE30_01880 [Polyangiaceae bacterium]|nr:hypothetical protein [Polyangiaceae bacterium]
MRGPIRPPFVLETNLAPDEVKARVEEMLRSEGRRLCGLSFDGRIELHVPPERRHLWSPELRVDVIRTEHGSRLGGAYGPHPHVWSAYVALYALLGMGAFVAGTFGFAEWAIRERPVALYALVPALLGAVGLYALSLLGQSLAAEQMDELRDALVAELVRPRTTAPPRSGVRARVPGQEEVRAGRRAG